MKNRDEVIKTTYLAKKSEDGTVIEAIKFTQDKRPGLERMSQQTYIHHGFSFTSDSISFETKEAGNEAYKQALADGYEISTAKVVEDFINYLYLITY